MAHSEVITAAVTIFNDAKNHIDHALDTYLCQPELSEHAASFLLTHLSTMSKVLGDLNNEADLTIHTLI